MAGENNHRAGNPCSRERRQEDNAKLVHIGPLVANPPNQHQATTFGSPVT